MRRNSGATPSALMPSGLFAIAFAASPVMCGGSSVACANCGTALRMGSAVVSFNKERRSDCHNLSLLISDLAAHTICPPSSRDNSTWQYIAHDYYAPSTRRDALYLLPQRQVRLALAQPCVKRPNMPISSSGPVSSATAFPFVKSTRISKRSAGEIVSCVTATGADRKPPSDAMT